MMAMLFILHALIFAFIQNDYFDFALENPNILTIFYCGMLEVDFVTENEGATSR